MNTTLQITKVVCLVTLTAAVCLFLWRLDSVIQHEAKDLQSLPQTLKGVQGVVQSVQTTLGKLDAVADKNTVYYEQAAEQVPKTEHEVRKLIVGLDKGFNDPFTGTIAQLNKAIATAADDTHKTMGHVDEAVVTANGTLGMATQSLRTLNEQIANPQIPELVGHLNMAALHFEQATDNGNKILGHGNHIIGWYDTNLTTPQGFVKTLGQGLFKLVVPGADVWTAWHTGVVVTK